MNLENETLNLNEFVTACQHLFSMLTYTEKREILEEYCSFKANISDEIKKNPKLTVIMICKKPLCMYISLNIISFYTKSTKSIRA